MKVTEYQVNQHDEYGDVFHCERVESLAVALRYYDAWVRLIGTGEGHYKIDAVTVEKVSIVKRLGRLDDSEYETIKDSAVA